LDGQFQKAASEPNSKENRDLFFLLPPVRNIPLGPVAAAAIG
jgi:hypothetical protein